MSGNVHRAVEKEYWLESCGAFCKCCGQRVIVGIGWIGFGEVYGLYSTVKMAIF